MAQSTVSIQRIVLAVWLLAITRCSVLALGPQVVATTLPNGAQLLVSEQHNLPLVVIEVVLDAGSRFDPPRKYGLANLTAELLTEGTKTRGAAAIKEAIDSLGGSLSVSADEDYAVVELRTLRDDLASGVDLLADVLIHPVFAEDELSRRRESVLAHIRAKQDNPSQVAETAFLEALFGNGPYGHEVEGTAAGVTAITRADVRDFYARYYRPSRAIVVVVGDVTTVQANTLFTRTLADWRGTVEAAPLPEAGATPGPRVVRIDKPVTQAGIVMGQGGVARNDPDYEALSVMNYTLGGGGFSSRLMDNIRTQAGLAYSVGSFFTVSKSPGSFQIVMQTKNASVTDAISRARSEVERLRTDGITEEELSEAKRYLTGSFPLRLDSNAKIAQFLGQIAFYGLGLDYADTYIKRINAVTREDVQRVAREHLHPEAMIDVIVANLQEAKLPE